MSHEKCNTCGLCKANCPIYEITKNESESPRAKLVLLKENVINDIFQNCLMCDACKLDCPSEIDIPKDIRKARTTLVNTLQISKKDKELIQNLRETGNIYGI